MRSFLIAATFAAGLVGVAAGAQAAPVSGHNAGLTASEAGIVSVRMSPRERMMRERMMRKRAMHHRMPHHR
jgi:hypothetical protein